MRKRQPAARSGSPGDEPEDFRAFVAECGPQLYRTACLLTAGDTHLAEDLVQEALVSVCMKWDERRDIANPMGYAQTTLVNAFISMRRRRSSREKPSTLPDVGAAEGHDVDLRLTLVAALAQMSELDRAVLVLRYWEDRTVEETASTLELSTNAVRTRAFRALGRLRERLGADFVEFAQS